MLCELAYQFAEVDDVCEYNYMTGQSYNYRRLCVNIDRQFHQI